MGELELANDSVRLMFPINYFCRRMGCWRVNGEDGEAEGDIQGMGPAVAEP